MFELLLRIHLAALAFVGTLFLGFAQDDLSLAMVTLLAAIVSLTLSDIKRWFLLPRPAANLAAILAVGFSFRDYLNTANQMQLAAIANLLTYLQIILFFQEKQHRLYWQLLTLSLLQVVVSAALSLGPAFGVLGVAYMFVMFSTLTLFFLVRELAAVQKSSAADEPLTAANSPAAPAWKRLLSGVSRAEFVLPYRAAATDFFRGGLVLQILMAAAMTLVFSATMFYVSPRQRGLNWHSIRNNRVATVGFSPQITFQEMGQVLQDETVAMRVSFYDAQGQPYLLKCEPYWRGAVLTTYGSPNGKPGSWEVPRVIPASLPAPPPNSNVVRQVVRLEPTVEPALFGLFPVHADAETPSEVRFDRRQHQIYRTTGSPPAHFRYTLYTTGLRDGRQVELLPAGYRGRSLRDRRFQPGDRGVWPPMREELTEIDIKKFPTLIALANQAVAQVPDSSDFHKARLLETHFRDSGRYQYSLNFNMVRNRELDPVEDFVANHRVGHCEYFASALALMLRSQGIPSRVVIGYHGGEYNSVGNYWLVRQRDAHAWVEAFIEPKDLLDAPTDQQELPDGGWLRLDPTPSISRADRIAGNDQSSLNQLLGYFHYLWNDYVLGLNAERQQTGIYTPLTTTSTNAFDQLTDLGGWRRWLLGDLPKTSDLNPATKATHDSFNIEHWFSWRAAVAGSFLGAVGFGILNLMEAVRGRHSRTRKFLRRLRGMFGVRFAEGPWRVDFYHQFETACRQRGLRRTVQQTQREFVAQLGDAAGLIENEPAQAAAQRIVGHFYRVRFGAESITEQEAASINDDLRIVETALRPGERPMSR